METRPRIIASKLAPLLLLFLFAGAVFIGAKSVHGAPLTVKVGYPQPSGASIPLWVITEARTDHRYGVDVQPIYISGGARLTQTVVSGDIEIAMTGKVPYMTEEIIRSVLSVSDHPKALKADPKDFFDNRLLKELEETGFVQELYGRQ